jgi:hypothetical protein
MAKPKKRRKIIIFSIIGLALVALSLVAIFKKRQPVITVQTEKVALHSLTNIVVANGKIQPVVQVTISPEVSGEIIELPVKEGQEVKKGDLLVKINPDKPRPVTNLRLPPKPRRRRTWKKPRRTSTATGNYLTASCFQPRISLVSNPLVTWPRRNSTAPTTRSM